MPITFDVNPSLKPSNGSPQSITVDQHLYQQLNKTKGKLLKFSKSSNNYIKTQFSNGFVGACVVAYNGHFPLQISPDDVWVTIMTSFSRFVNKKAEQLRSKFVSHEGKIQLSAVGGGNILTANYDDLINQLSVEIDKNTVGDVRDWMVCNFTTSTPLTRIVSKVVLMAALKEFFGYKMYLCCGLPKVTLLGTVEDWKEIRKRIEKLREFGEQDLADWADVLGYVLDYFVAAFSSSPIDTDFWNRIASITGGGSGPRYLEGWVLAFVGFDEDAQYILNSLESIKNTNSFAQLETNAVPTATVQVPVEIDDNGELHNTMFFAGPMMPTQAADGTVSPSLDWAFIDIPICK